MRKHVVVALVMCLLAGLLAAGALADSQSVPAAAPAAIPGIDRVLVVSMDGMRPDALRDTGAPNITALAARGAYAWDAQTVLPAVTLPAHASMLTGLDVDEHGLSHNNNPRECEPILTPTFLTLAETAGYQTGMVSGKEKFCLFHQSATLHYTFARAGDRSVVDAVIERLDAGDEVIFAHLPNPDYFGHLHGWMSSIYLYETLNTDAQVGRLLAALDERGLNASTLVILTADHGGHEFSHGMDIPEDRNVPWIMAGPGVQPGVELRGVSVADTAPTVLWALGLTPNASQLGRARLDAFDPALADAVEAGS